MERGGRNREVLEHLGAGHALKRVRWEEQLDGIRLSERGIRPEPPAGAMEQHVRQVHAESSAGAAADLEDSVARPRRQARPDPAHTLALDPRTSTLGWLWKRSRSYLPTIASFHAWISARFRNLQGATLTTL